MGRLLKLLPLVAMLCISTTYARTVRAEVRPDDSAITFWIQDALRDDPRIMSPNIEVSTTDGIVKLSGRVKSITAKKYADLESKKIKGVLGVINELTVEPELRYDWDISQDIRHRLVNSEFIRSHDLMVTASDGTVTLTGEVDSWAQKEWAEMLAGEVRGVKAITNDLTLDLASTRPDEEIAKDVVATIVRDAYLTGLPIKATVQDGTVTLTGSVGNWFQKDRAQQCARFAAGVGNVINDLKVEWWQENGVRSSSPSPSDTELKRFVYDAVFQDTRIHPGKLLVEASLGNVTLRGSMPTYYQRKLAEQDARDVVGVNWVTNLLAVATHPRSDSSIEREIKSDFSSDYLLNGEDVVVRVSDGVVTLNGNVNEDFERTHANRVASRVSGVLDVVNLIQVNPPPKYTDTALEQRIRDRLRHDAETRWVADQIRVTVHDGKAVLEGSVNFWSEKDEADHIASFTDGVWSVDNQIQVHG